MQYDFSALLGAIYTLINPANMIRLMPSNQPYIGETIGLNLEERFSAGNKDVHSS